MRLIQLKYIFLPLIFLINTYAFAQDRTINGSWRSYDDTGTARSIVIFSTHGNSLHGKIARVFPVSGKDSKTCSHCQGALQNKPLEGLVIFTGTQQEPNKYAGRILDPDTGKSYDCVITLSDDGSTLHVYPHVGPFGKTVDWQRSK